MSFYDSTYKKLFLILLSLQAVILILQIVGKEISSGIMMFFLQIVMLIVAHCCLNSSFAALYSIFSLIFGLYAFNPVGLFIVGHGQAKTTAQNICCVFVFILALVCSYLGYLYTRALMGQEILEVQNNENDNGGFSQGLGGGFNSYGGSNTFQRVPEERQSGNRFQYRAGENRSSGNNTQKKEFKAFSGQGYSLQ